MADYGIIGYTSRSQEKKGNYRILTWAGHQQGEDIGLLDTFESIEKHVYT
jgi:hypothetical protein